MSSSTISDDTSTQSSRFGGRGRYPPSSAARGRGDTSTSSFTQGRAGGRISNARAAPSTSYSTTNRNEPSSSNNTAPSLPASGIPYGHVPSYLPGSASLVEQLDQRLLVVLRDGRHLIGTLRSFDQFSNMVFQNTVERRILMCKKKSKGLKKMDSKRLVVKEDTCCYYTDIQLGLYLIRGDATVLMGEVDEDSEDQRRNDHMIPVSLEDFESLNEKWTEDGQEKEKEEKEEEEVVKALTWDFDTDLVV